MQQNTSIVELVLYRLKVNPGDHLTTIVNATNKVIQQFPGFRSREVFQSMQDERILMDYVLWDDLASAKSAFAKFPETPEIAPFATLIERPEYFQHFKIVNRHTQEESEGQITELVIYRLKPEWQAQSREFFDTYSREILNCKGYRHRHHLQSNGKPRVWAERASWDDLEKALAAAAEMENNPTLKAAFSRVEEVILMQHFKKLG